MKTILYINTSQSDQTSISIIRDGQKKEYIEKTGDHKSQNVLPLIEKALQEEKLIQSDITEIEVATGPGSFTGVRVGISVANTLAWALGIPVNGQKIAVPLYDKSKYD